MDKQTYDSYNFKKVRFDQINTIERYGNLAVSYTTEKVLKEMISEIEEKMNKKVSYREQQIDTSFNSFGQSEKKQNADKKKAGRPSNVKHWILEYK